MIVTIETHSIKKVFLQAFTKEGPVTCHGITTRQTKSIVSLEPSKFNVAIREQRIAEDDGHGQSSMYTIV